MKIHEPLTAAGAGDRSFILTWLNTRDNQWKLVDSKLCSSSYNDGLAPLIQDW